MTATLRITLTDKIDGKPATRNHVSEYDDWTAARRQLGSSAAKSGYHVLDNGTIRRAGVTVGHWLIVTESD
jgi:hypothetical protein